MHPLSNTPTVICRSRLAPVGPEKAARSIRASKRRDIRTGALLDKLIKPLVASNKGKPLNEGIANFYDESTPLWESMWGEHLHHGYYGKDDAPKSNADAQVDMIEEIIKWANLDKVSKMVDVGCGVGGSSRHIARKLGAHAKGITLSPVQAARANELAQAEGLGSQCSFEVADALDQPFQDASFDLVWSLESGEHMPTKPKFVRELVRVCQPGGKVVIVTWCHRNLKPGEKQLTQEEQSLLDRVCEAYYLPAWCSLHDYEQLFKEQGMQNVKTADWSEEVAPFWGAVIKSAVSAEGIRGLFKAGWTTIKGALVMPLMSTGYRMGLIKFVLITAEKPRA